MLILELPLPPTINHYFGRRGTRTFLNKAGKAYRVLVQDIIAEKQLAMLTGRLQVYVAVYPANRIRQDIDNRLKSLLDALTHAGVWEDDSQIDDLHIVRQPVLKGGKCAVVITEIGE
jgi:crossover junction endodeoxyribonuclease RusA